MKLADIDLSLDLSKSDYERQLYDNNLKIVALQAQLIETNTPVVLAFEGWDAAGKGGAISRLTEFMDGRRYQVHGISKPTSEELAHHYLWRFWTRLPPRGHMAIFDRTWYGRVLVERIEGFATDQEWQRAYDEINRFEYDLTANGYCLVKCFIHIDPDEQLKRFNKRLADPLKKWKMSDEDYRNREKWQLYTKAIDDMLERTNTDCAPWHLIAGNSKKFARIAVQNAFITTVSKFLE